MYVFWGGACGGGGGVREEGGMLSVRPVRESVDMDQTKTVERQKEV